MRAIEPTLRPRARRSLLRCACAATLVVSSLLGCGSPGAGYPDRPGVEAAQASWCDGLAKIHGGPDGWEPLSKCKSAYPTGSPGFIKGMTKCYAERMESLGDQAPDTSAIVADCTDEVVVKLSFDESAARELLEARCQWTFRCAQAPVDECKAAFGKLDSALRVGKTTRFNGAAQHQIADCLNASSCSEESEDAAFEACYRSAEEKVVWFPL
jgi:hypothetical protein